MTSQDICLKIWKSDEGFLGEGWAVKNYVKCKRKAEAPPKQTPGFCMALGLCKKIGCKNDSHNVKMHGQLVTRSSRHKVNSSQRCYTWCSTCHTILGCDELTGSPDRRPGVALSGPSRPWLLPSMTSNYNAITTLRKHLPKRRSQTCS